MSSAVGEGPLSRAPRCQVCGQEDTTAHLCANYAPTVVVPLQRRQHSPEWCDAIDRAAQVAMTFVRPEYARGEVPRHENVALATREETALVIARMIQELKT